MEKLVEELHPLERKIIPFLKDNSSLEDLKSESRLSEVEILRALRWLESKNVLKIHKEVLDDYYLGELGRLYQRDLLPELRLLKEISKKEKKLQDIKLDKEERSISLGELKKRKAINIKPGMLLKITNEGKKILKNSIPEQDLLDKIKESKISQDDFSLLQRLRKRKNIIEVKKISKVSIELTELGKRLKKVKLEDNTVNVLTSAMLKSGSWKNKKFRSYNLQEPAPKVYAGKRHFSNEAVDYIKKVWIEMGFKEMTGPIVESEFWNFDALFVPQDHPAREMQDTFFINKKTNIKEKNILSNVKKTHENGWTTNSKGWGYKFNEELSKKLVLRTHTTSFSARTLANLKKEDIPGKYFSVNKVFRNEAVDWSHAFEFTQVEGIVVDPKANFRNLLGYLKQYYKKLGFGKVRFRPAYFPYTEMSVEAEVYVEEKKQWMELGGAGIFRPEVVKPLLGIDVPVLAWGQGMDRSILEYFDIKDLREIHKNDLKKLREIKNWIK